MLYALGYLKVAERFWKSWFKTNLAMAQGYLKCPPKTKQGEWLRILRRKKPSWREVKSPERESEKSERRKQNAVNSNH